MASAKALGHENSFYVWGTVAEVGGRGEALNWFRHTVCWWISLRQTHSSIEAQECGGSKLYSGVGIQGSR